MIPELGKYAGTVLWAYGASLALLGVLVFVTLRTGRKVRRAMEKVENRNG
ncbi:MAG: heme exporter protein CcmD [Ascidiaceihabitans sp.]|jgi:heme exporter protein D|nr:heme exporter protein CcmD [Ascidiaceihabitans sp.]